MCTTRGTDFGVHSSSAEDDRVSVFLLWNRIEFLSGFKVNLRLAVRSYSAEFQGSQKSVSFEKQFNLTIYSERSHISFKAEVNIYIHIYVNLCPEACYALNKLSD